MGACFVRLERRGDRSGNGSLAVFFKSSFGRFVGEGCGKLSEGRGSEGRRDEVRPGGSGRDSLPMLLVINSSDFQTKLDLFDRRLLRPLSNVKRDKTRRDLKRNLFVGVNAVYPDGIDAA